MDLALLEKSLLGLFTAIVVAIIVSKLRGKRFKLPPGPFPVPVFGNWLQVGDDLNHRNLTDYAKKFGEIFLLRMGQRNLVVVSSPDLAKEVLHTQGVEFGSRTRNVVFDIFTGKGQDMVFTVYGEHWRKMRRIMTVPFFTNKVVQQYRFGWEDEIARVVEDVKNMPEASTVGIVLRKRLQLMMYNNMYRLMFDRRFESEEDPLFLKLKALNGERSRLTQSFDYNYGDFIPILKPFLRGYLKICKDVKERRIQLFKDYFLDERKKLTSTRATDNAGIKCAIDYILDAEKKGEINEDNVLYIVENINVAVDYSEKNKREAATRPLAFEAFANLTPEERSAFVPADLKAYFPKELPARRATKGGRSTVEVEEMPRQKLKKVKIGESGPMSPPPVIQPKVSLQKDTQAKGPEAAKTPAGGSASLLPPPLPHPEGGTGGSRKRGHEDLESEDEELFRPIFDVKKTDKGYHNSKVATAIVHGSVLPEDVKAVNLLTENVLCEQAYGSVYKLAAQVDRLTTDLKGRSNEVLRVQARAMKDKDALTKMTKARDNALADVERHRALLDKAHEDVAARNKRLKDVREKYAEVVAYYEAELDRDLKIGADNGNLVADLIAFCKEHHAECASFAAKFETFMANHPDSDEPEIPESEAPAELTKLLEMRLGETPPEKTKDGKATSDGGGIVIQETSTVSLAADGKVSSTSGNTEHILEKAGGPEVDAKTGEVLKPL